MRSAFRSQAKHCAALGSPFTAWLCERFAQRLDTDTRVGTHILHWPGEPSSAGDSVALRLCGALHALALTERSPELAALYPQIGEATWVAVEQALETHADFVLRFLVSPPQTNEVARAAALYPALCEIARRTALPLDLLEVGASAGLNLNCDRFCYRLGGRTIGDPSSPLVLEPQWKGHPPPNGEPRIAGRRGCDLRPFRLSEEAERTRLLSYVWPDQSERLGRLRTAIGIAERHPVTVDEADAVLWLRERLREPENEAVRVIYSTIAWQYLPPNARAEGERTIAAAGGRAKQPLAWLRFEADGSEPGAAITLRMWPGFETEHLGRADFHGRWVRWSAA